MDYLREEARAFEKFYSGRLDFADDGTLVNEPPPVQDKEFWYASVVTSEVLHHLRAALEHVAYRLAWKNMGEPVDGTQFPIEDSPEKFEGRITGSYKDVNGKTRNCAPFLKHIHPAHIDLMRALQPFPGGPTWLGLLRDLSNEDRHRIPVRIDFSSEAESWQVVAGEGAEKRLLAVEGFRHALLVFTLNGRSVTEVLEILEREVSATVDAFECLLNSP
jgi:hypothetical protein